MRFSKEKKYNVGSAFEKIHLIELLKAGGTKLVDSYEELDKAILDYLENPNTDKEERDHLKQRFIEPCDGKSSERIVEQILKMAGVNKTSCIELT